jgi:hypothetical protein
MYTEQLIGILLIPCSSIVLDTPSRTPPVEENRASADNLEHAWLSEKLGKYPGMIASLSSVASFPKPQGADRL